MDLAVEDNVAHLLCALLGGFVPFAVYIKEKFSNYRVLDRLLIRVFAKKK